jgi:predicted nucleic acid-binding protein
VSGERAPAFLDTSYVVRYLVNDPPDMAQKAADVIDGDEILVLSEIVLLETAYVLTSVYSVPRAAVVDSLTELVQRANLRLANLPKARALEALQLCRSSGRVSFADALIWAQALDRGAERIYAFDRRFPNRGVAVEGLRRAREQG